MAAARGKPALVVDSSYQLWVGNESSEEVHLEPGEIAGFNLGTFEEKIVAGSVNAVVPHDSLL